VNRTSVLETSPYPIPGSQPLLGDGPVAPSLPPWSFVNLPLCCPGAGWFRRPGRGGRFPCV